MRLVNNRIAASIFSLFICYLLYTVGWITMSSYGKTYTYICDDLLPVSIPKWDDVPPFQTVVDKELWVKSAFFDTRHGPRGIVRLIGISSTRFGNLYCTLWYNKCIDKCKRVVSMQAVLIKTAATMDVNNFKHMPFFFNCETPSGQKPDYVSLSTRACDNAPNLLEVQSLVGYPSNKTSTLAACLPMLRAVYYPYNLLEWLALHRIMGVDHVFIYDTMSVSDDVQRIINYYRSIKYVSIVRWSLEESVSVRAFAHRAMLNDCAYRNYGNYKYVISYDLDEYIVPQTEESIKVFADRHMKNGVNLISVKRSNFCMDKASGRLSRPTMRTMRFTKHTDAGDEAEPKVLYKPESAVEVGIHYVEVRAPGAKANYPLPSEALVHHYRIHLGWTPNCKHNKTIVLKYKSRLKAAMNVVLNIVQLPLIK